MMLRRLTMIILLMILIIPLRISAQDAPVPEPVSTALVQQIQIDYQGVQFRIDASLAESIGVVHYPAAEGDVMLPMPAYTEFSFEGYGDGDYVRFSPLPRIDVFTIEDFGPYPYAIQQLDSLSQILAERPDLNQYVKADPGTGSAQMLPFLPIFNAAQVIRAQPQYIEVDGMRGIRYLVYYSQALNPIREGEVFYTFQGITKDGQHYVSAIFPVNTGTLPTEDPVIEDYDTWAQNYQQYLNDIVGHLTTADTANFSPSLSILDSIVQSIEVK